MDAEWVKIRDAIEKAGRNLKPDKPREIHSEVMKERPKKWTPNSSLDVLGKDGNLLQRRFYDSNGDIEEMIDYIRGKSCSYLFPYRHIEGKERSKPIRY